MALGLAKPDQISLGKWVCKPLTAIKHTLALSPSVLLLLSGLLDKISSKKKEKVKLTSRERTRGVQREKTERVIEARGGGGNSCVCVFCVEVKGVVWCKALPSR